MRKTNNWAVTSMERALEKGAVAILCIIGDDRWDWSIIDREGVKVADGEAASKHQARVHCHRTAAKLGLITSGSGLGKG